MTICCRTITTIPRPKICQTNHRKLDLAIRNGVLVGIRMHREPNQVYTCCWQYWYLHRNEKLILLPLIPRVVVFQSIDDEPLSSQLYWGASERDSIFKKVVVNRHITNTFSRWCASCFPWSLHLSLITYLRKRVRKFDGWLSAIWGHTIGCAELTSTHPVWILVVTVMWLTRITSAVSAGSTRASSLMTARWFLLPLLLTSFYSHAHFVKKKVFVSFLSHDDDDTTQKHISNVQTFFFLSFVLFS